MRLEKFKKTMNIKNKMDKKAQTKAIIILIITLAFILVAWMVFSSIKKKILG